MTLFPRPVPATGECTPFYKPIRLQSAIFDMLPSSGPTITHSPMPRGAAYQPRGSPANVALYNSSLAMTTHSILRCTLWDFEQLGGVVGSPALSLDALRDMQGHCTMPPEDARMCRPSLCTQCTLISVPDLARLSGKGCGAQRHISHPSITSYCLVCQLLFSIHDRALRLRPLRKCCRRGGGGLPDG